MDKQVNVFKITNKNNDDKNPGAYSTHEHL